MSHFIWQDSSNSDMQVWVSSFYLFICLFFVCYFVFPFTLEWKIIEVSAFFLSSVPQPSWNWPSGPPGKYIGLLEGAGLNTGQRKSCQPAWLPSYTQHLLPSHTNSHHLISGCLQVNCVLIRTKCTQLSMIYIYNNFSNENNNKGPCTHAMTHLHIYSHILNINMLSTAMQFINQNKKKNPTHSLSHTHKHTISLSDKPAVSWAETVCPTFKWAIFHRAPWKFLYSYQRKANAHHLSQSSQQEPDNPCLYMVSLAKQLIPQQTKNACRCDLTATGRPWVQLLLQRDIKDNGTWITGNIFTDRPGITGIKRLVASFKLIIANELAYDKSCVNFSVFQHYL